MLDAPLLFIDIDTQRDFLEPDGSLYVPGSLAIHPNLARLTHHARTSRVPVIASACAHSLDEVDPEPFPPHCLIGSPGQERIDATRWEGSRVLHLGETLPDDEPTPAHLTLWKTRYDLFSRPDAARLFERYASAHATKPTFVVYGVATDYCVRCAVEGLRERGHNVAVVVDAIRPIDPDAEADLLTAWAKSGVLLITTDTVAS
jgi:nicotinamidase/pyrazinamidase